MKSDGEQYFFPRATKQETIFGADWGTGEDLFLHFSVNDTGVGLTSNEMKNLFLRFSQASPKTHVTYGGSYKSHHQHRASCKTHTLQVPVWACSFVKNWPSSKVVALEYRLYQAKAVTSSFMSELVEPRLLRGERPLIWQRRSRRRQSRANLNTTARRVLTKRLAYVSRTPTTLHL
jgi:hypothetical protein